MSFLTSRQLNINRSAAFSGSVLAALLTALLLLSPTTARALADVLAENGVAIPAHVVRVLDTLPVDPTREMPRRLTESDEAEMPTVVVAAPLDREPVVDTVACLTISTVACPQRPSASPVSPVRIPEERASLRRTIPGRRSPRAPPLFPIA